MTLLAIFFSIFVFVSICLKRTAYFAFAGLMPCATGSWLIVLNPQFGYINISTISIVCFLFLGLILVFFDLVSDKAEYHSNLKFVNVDRYFLTYVILGIGIAGFILKLFIYLPEYSIIDAIYKILKQPEYFSKLFSDGYSIMHYTGYLGLIYFCLLKPSRSFLYFGALFLTLIYLITLFLLFIKVQIVIGIYIVFWSLIFSSHSPKKSIFKFGILIITLGLGITIYDNFKVSGNLYVAYEFLIRYLGGSMIGFSEFMDSNRQSQAFSFNGYFIGRYNPLLEFMGMDTFTFPDKVLYDIGTRAGNVNTGTLIQSMMLDFGYIGWIFGLLFFILTIIVVRFLAQKSLILTEISFPFIIITQVGFSLIHIGNGFWKLELIIISFLHILLLFAERIWKNFILAVNTPAPSDNKRKDIV